MFSSFNKLFMISFSCCLFCRDIFSLGFGPFRWVCTSGDPQDLATTDDIATTVLEEISANVTEHIRQQYSDNIRWIREAGKHKMASDFLKSIDYRYKSHWQTDRYILFSHCHLPWFTLCSGGGIPSQNPLLWPERQSLHCPGYQPSCCWWKSFSKRKHCLLGKLFNIDMLELFACLPVFTRGSAHRGMWLFQWQWVVVFVSLRRLWLSAETIMMSVAQTAPSERPPMCMTDLPSVQVHTEHSVFLLPIYY